MKRNEMYNIKNDLKELKWKDAETFTCLICKEEKPKNEFFRRSVNDNYEDGFCKECFMNEYFGFVGKHNGDINKAIYCMCEGYHLPYSEELIESIKIELNAKNCTASKSAVFKKYMKDIYDLSMWRNKKFDRHEMKLGETNSESTTFTKVCEETGRPTEISNSSECIDIEKISDLEFINEDIEQIKINAQKATNNNDPNQHGKWLNSFRDALTLREELKRLEDNSNTYDLYFDWSRKEDGTTEAVIMFKGEVHRIIRDDINAIAKYIYELCYKTNVYIYGDSFGTGMGIADCLSELGLIVSPTKIRANVVTKDKLTDNERILEYRDYYKKVLNRNK